MAKATSLMFQFQYYNTLGLALLSLFYIILTLKLAESAPDSALITQLPGFTATFPSKHYSGYL